jgi:hypothetical protein
VSQVTDRIEADYLIETAWPLAEAAEACFGTAEWPSTHPVPQASIEFDVEDVEAATQELVDAVAEVLEPDDYPTGSTCNAFDKAQVLRAW